MNALYHNTHSSAANRFGKQSHRALEVWRVMRTWILKHKQPPDPDPVWTWSLCCVVWNQYFWNCLGLYFAGFCLSIRCQSACEFESYQGRCSTSTATEVIPRGACGRLLQACSKTQTLQYLQRLVLFTDNGVWRVFVRNITWNELLLAKPRMSSWQKFM